MSIITNPERIGAFTSSEIFKLTTRNKKGDGFGAPALSYIEEKKMERRLGRSITTDNGSRATLWGSLLEGFVNEELSLKYELCSQQTVVHPEIPYWAGSTDGKKHGKVATVADIKSPYTLKSFCQLVDPLYNGLSGMDAMNAVRENHSDGEKFYWQLVSNACIHNAEVAELIVFCPFQSQLQKIRNLAEGMNEYYRIYYSVDSELPYLPDDGYYNNLNIISFPIPQADKDFLTERVIEAGKLLQPTLSLAHGDTINGQDIVIIEPVK